MSVRASKADLERLTKRQLVARVRRLEAQLERTYRKVTPRGGIMPDPVYYVLQTRHQN